MLIGAEELYVAAAVGLIGKFSLRKINSFWLHSLINLPATIAHEAAHLVMALITLAKPVSFSIIPRRDGNTWVFGSVQCARLTQFNAFPVAMAPLLLLLIPYILSENLKGMPLSAPEVATIYLATALVCLAAIPSGQDFKVAASKWFGSAAWILAIGYGVLSSGA